MARVKVKLGEAMRIDGKYVVAFIDGDGLHGVLRVHVPRSAIVDYNEDGPRLLSSGVFGSGTPSGDSLCFLEAREGQYLRILDRGSVEGRRNNTEPANISITPARVTQNLIMFEVHSRATTLKISVVPAYPSSHIVPLQVKINVGSDQLPLNASFCGNDFSASDIELVLKYLSAVYREEGGNGLKVVKGRRMEPADVEAPL